MRFFPYSILMSVYSEEKAENLIQSIESMLNQTMPSDDFLLVCDGPLTDKLDSVITGYREKYPEQFHVLRIYRNGGLGRALRIGLPYCKHELIARMDSDDISYPDRCERELDAFKKHPDLDLLSGTIAEFTDDPKKIHGVRRLPETQEDIIAYSRKRNPMNHPAVMFRKTAVLKAGSYRSKYPLFEDYDLWVRMLMKGSHAANLSMRLVNMRVSSNLYDRRGGKQYAQDLLRFHTDLLHSGWERPKDYFAGAIPHALICMAPNDVRKEVYHLIHK